MLNVYRSMGQTTRKAHNRGFQVAKSSDLHFGPLPNVIATAQGLLSTKLIAEFEVLSNLIYLARHEPAQRDKYLKIAEEMVARIRLRLQDCRSSKAA
jgi:hypothetical protein